MKTSGYRSTPIKRVFIKSYGVNAVDDISTLFPKSQSTHQEIPIEKIEKGYKTSTEYAELYNISERTIQRRIKNLYKRGMVQIKMHHTNSILGHKVKVAYYKVPQNCLSK